MRFGRLTPFYDADGAGGGGTSGTEPEAQPASASQIPQSAPAIDYEKLAKLVAGKQAVTEEGVLKGYFKQQGLTKEQVDQAIASFKQQQAASQPDVNALQAQAAQAQALARQMQLQNAATMAAVSMGIDAKAIPYVIKMADMAQVTGQDGKINDEALSAAINKVLEDVPAMKPQAADSAGFVQVGAPGQGGTATAVDAELDKIFGVKK